MNPVEIEEEISKLAEQEFDPAVFPYAFLEAFGNKETTISRLKSGNSNKTDIEGAILQYNNIHLAVSPVGEVSKMLDRLKSSPATTRQKAKYILATDGEEFQAESLSNGDTIACTFKDFPDHFGFFLPLAGISTVKQITDDAFDIRATSRLNKLYIELLKDNPEWGTEQRRHDLNHFMARLIFCFFAEDTDIFISENLFTNTVEQMSAKDSSNSHEVIGEIFRAMNTKITERASAKLPRWADTFPYVNGGLFSGRSDTPIFTKIARAYLLRVGKLDWKKINPDIFGSMIQAVADDEERGSLGMHYTSVPNILKVLNPLFLDDLRGQLEEAVDNSRMLLNLRKRISRIRVFDPACGSGNFLVIAYKEMRKLEFEINQRRGEPEHRTEIPITNYRGIELRDFPAEIARLALIIAEYQCDVSYRGQKEALAEFLPLDTQNWITCGNALELDWLSICPPTGKGVKVQADDLFKTPLDQAQIDFENEGGETYICGNPPYLGSTWQTDKQKKELMKVFDGRAKNWKSLDYVAGWFMKAADYGTKTNAVSAFVSTNSICQGQQVPILWPLIFATGHEICFAHTSFKWANLASHNAGVTVAIVGISNHAGKIRRLYSMADNGTSVLKEVDNINAYLVAGKDVVVDKALRPLNALPEMVRGNMPYDGGHLLLTSDELSQLDLTNDQRELLIRRIYGSAEFIRGLERYCLWIEDKNLQQAVKIEALKKRFEGVREMRLSSSDKSANDLAKKSHQMREMNIGQSHTIAIAAISSENREFLPGGLLSSRETVTNKIFALYDAPLWNLSLILSRLHWVWIGSVCVRLEMRFSYSNTLGWNTFPVPILTEKNKADLTRCAENILIARERHFPATIADLYEPESMPDDLRHAHEQNDEVLERIYIGRQFKNDTERLEKLFELYAKMTSEQKRTPTKRKAKQ